MDGQEQTLTVEESAPDREAALSGPGEGLLGAGEEISGRETPLEEAAVEREVPREGAGAGADRRGEVETFLRTFPGVEAGDIPEEVWARAAGGLGLTGAWALYENGLLRQRLAALEQNGANRARCLGSLGSRQSVSGGGSIEAYWEEAGG